MSSLTGPPAVRRTVVRTWRWSARFAVMAMVAAVVAPGAAHAAPDGRLSGRLFDPANAPLAGATVKATDPTTGATVQAKADTNGHYALALTADTWDLAVTGTVQGRPVEARVNAVAVDGDTSRDVMVAAHPVRFSGTVHDSTGGVIPGGWVSLDDRGAKVGTDGRFSLTVSPGTYRLRISGWTMSASVEKFRLDTDTTLDFVLPVVPVDVNVRNGGGQPVSGVRVTVASSDTAAPFQVIPGKATVATNSSEMVTDASGHIRVLALPTSSNLRVSAVPPTPAHSFTARSTGPLTAARTVDVVLSDTVRLTGAVRNPDGSVPPGDVTIGLSTDDNSGGSAEMGRDGSFTVAAPPGHYRLTVGGSNYFWHDDQDGTDYDGYDFWVTADNFVLSGGRHVDLRLPFRPVPLTVVDPDGTAAGADIQTTSGSVKRTAQSTVELLPGSTGTAWIHNIWTTGGDGAATLQGLPGADVTVAAGPYDNHQAPYAGTITPGTGGVTVELPTPVPVRFTSQYQGQPSCADFTVTGEDGISREPGARGDLTCTLGLRPGRYHLSSASRGQDSGEYNLEWFSISADYTVTGPATLKLNLPSSPRARVDIVNASGNPLGGALILDAAPKTIDLGSGIDAVVRVSGRFEEAGAGGESSFEPLMFGRSTFSGTFRSERGPYAVAFAGLSLVEGGHVTIAYPSAGADGDPTTTADPNTTTPPQPTTPPLTDQSSGAAATIARAKTGRWALSSDGKVFNFGDAPDLGDTSTGAVDLEPAPTGKGYWTLNRNGTVQPFGDAAELGDVDVAKLTKDEQPASLSATPSGKGYWIFTNRGRAIAFGDAPHLGDMSQVKLNGPVLGSIATPSGKGYYMVASDGGIFAFGDAAFAGSMGGRNLNAPVQSLVPDADGNGYWLVASDGGIFAFDAPFRGSMGDRKLNKPISGMVRYGDGYLMVGADGGIFNFSSAPFAGSLGDKPPAAPVVAVAALPTV